jgi:hypothetical protein
LCSPGTRIPQFTSTQFVHFVALHIYSFLVSWKVPSKRSRKLLNYKKKSQLSQPQVGDKESEKRLYYSLCSLHRFRLTPINLCPSKFEPVNWFLEDYWWYKYYKKYIIFKFKVIEYFGIYIFGYLFYDFILFFLTKRRGKNYQIDEHEMSAKKDYSYQSDQCKLSAWKLMAISNTECIRDEAFDTCVLCYTALFSKAATT